MNMKKTFRSFIKSIFNKRFRSIFAFLVLPIIVISMLTFGISPSIAASGGRIGGGSFRSPSIPRSSGYRGGYGGYGGGYRGGGLGFPFILPIFGFGGGGLFGFLILMSIAGVLVNAIRGGTNRSIPIQSKFSKSSSEKVCLIQLQLGLLAKAKFLQEDLRKIAETGETNDSIGLQRILQEATLSLLRRPDLWVYSNLESGTVPFNASESTFNRLSITERSKLNAEITSNFNGAIQQRNSSLSQPGDASQSNEYIAVTIILASKKVLSLNAESSSENLEENLRVIGSISSNDLLALEIIWQPEATGDVFTYEDLVTAYPNLKHL